MNPYLTTKTIFSVIKRFDQNQRYCNLPVALLFTSFYRHVLPPDMLTRNLFYWVDSHCDPVWPIYKTTLKDMGILKVLADNELSIDPQSHTVDPWEYS